MGDRWSKGEVVVDVHIDEKLYTPAAMYRIIILLTVIVVATADSLGVGFMNRRSSGKPT